MAGKKGQKKRVWSDDEKVSICTQARVAGVSVAQVARRYAMNANLIHKWLRDPRFSSEDQAADLPVYGLDNKCLAHGLVQNAMDAERAFDTVPGLIVAKWVEGRQ